MTLPITALNFAQSIGKALENTSDFTGVTAPGKGRSLVEVSKATRVEPVALIDQRVEHLPYMTDVMQSVNSIFSAYYMQAVSLLVNVDKIDVIKLLDRLNPSRDGSLSISMASHSSVDVLMKEESYKTQLPFFDKPLGLENWGLEAGVSDNAKEIRENVNLSVGKLLQVTIGHGDQKATFPVNVRLIATSTDPELIRDVLTIKARDTSLSARWHLYRAGQIEFVKDFIFCQDLIKSHKQALIKDKKQQFSEILKRRKDNGVAALLSGQSSLATISNIMVISDATRKEIERAEGFRFSDAKARDKLMEDTYTMILVVVDAEYERVTIYHQSISLPTEVTVRQIKSANKGGGTDITELLNAFREGSAPRF
jgi:hypothetical protein